MAKFNEYPAKTTPKDADKFMLYSAEDAANKLIDYDKLADAVLNKLTSKTFGLDHGTMTLPAALNQLNSKRPRSVQISKSGSALQECLNCLVLIVSPNAGAYDLYSCIGYQSDERRSKVTLLAGEGLHEITYSDEGTSYAIRGIYTIVNGNAANEATAYILPLT
jgi:hypothetical protein|nr:MAG TPA: hypothetical protein [Caudoviricetes sp.]